jgi:Tfp pilus assembly protein PilF
MQILGWQSVPCNFLSNPLCEESLVTRGVASISIIGKYLSLLALPVELSADYSYNSIPILRTPLAFGFVIPLAIIAGMLWVMFFNWRRHPILSWGIGFFFITGSIVFANAVHPFGNILAERYMYLPCIGFLLTMTQLAGVWIDRWRQSGATRIVLVLFLGVCSLYVARTWTRNQDWADNLHLFQSAVRVVPNSALVNNNLADTYFKQGALDLARSHYRRANEIHPKYASPLVGLGNIANERGNTMDAIQYFRKAELLGGGENIYLSLGRSYLDIGKLQLAQQAFERGLSMNPDDTRLYNNLGVVFIRQDMHPEAVATWQKALGVNPFDSLTLLNLATYYELNKQIDQAKEYYGRFLSVTAKGDHPAGRDRATRFLMNNE